MSFRKLFINLFAWFKRKPEPPIGGFFAPDTPLARFLKQSNWFSPQKMRVKQAAFIPPLNGKLSVFHVEGLDAGKVRNLSENMPWRACGWAVLPLREVHAQNLKVDFNENPERHADIMGWPAEKDQRKSIALELANASSLNLFPPAAE